MSGEQIEFRSLEAYIKFCGDNFWPNPQAEKELEALRARIRTLEGEMLYVKTTLEGRDRGSTHWQGCENDPRHWRCYLVKRIQAALDGGAEA